MIGIYNGAVQAGDQSGTLVSSDNRITVTLNSTNESSDVVTVGIRTTSEQYITVGDVELSFTGDKADMWCASEDNSLFSNWGEKLTLTNPRIGNQNKLIYLKAKSVQADGATNDLSTSLTVTCTIGSK